MFESAGRTHLRICRVAFLVALALSSVTGAVFAKPGKLKDCRPCQALAEVAIGGGAALLDELTVLAEGVGGTAQVAPDGDTVLAELPLSTAKTLSRRGFAVTPAKDASGAQRLKDGEQCVNAVPVEEGVSYTGATTFLASQVWYAFTPDESGVFAISLADSAFDTTLTVFGTCDGEPLAFNDDDGFLMTSALTMPLDAGVTYFILIDGFWGDSGNYVLRVESAMAAPGESCFSAVEIALDSVNEGAIEMTAPEAWYAFTPSKSGDYVISLQESEFDTILAVYDGCGGPALGYNDDSGDMRSRLGMYLYEGTSYSIKVSGWMGETGLYRLQVTSVTPPPHDTVGKAVPIDASQPFTGSTDGATSTLAYTECSIADSRDVWHSYVPAASGYVRITLDGDGFDATLAIFDEFRGAALACNDDVNSCSMDSSLCVDLVQGVSYLIRVAGYDGMTGPYTLTLDPVVQSLPKAPCSPNPLNGARQVAPAVVLSWDNWNVMEPVNSYGAHSGGVSPVVRGIYGRDDRLDEYQIQDPRVLAAGDATVVMVERASLGEGRGGYVLAEAPSLSEHVVGLCPDEPFRDQPTAGLCSGFLVAPDLIVTAGHCQGCGDEITEMAVVFGYVMQDAETVAMEFDADDVYFCEEIVASQTGVPDWSLVRLDRPVTGHAPVRIRRTGFVPERQSLLVVGHPVGLPRKYDSGGIVRDNWMLPYFSANLDTYGGNSGSAVFNLETLAVEGILVAGNDDFVDDWDNECVRSNVCPDSGCPSWERVVRTTTFSNLVPGYTVWLGTDPDDLAQVDAGVAAPQYSASGLEPGRTYHWRIIAQNAAGQVSGPIWSFTTAP